MKEKIWFQTDLGYEATKEKLKQQKDIIADWQDYKGILTLYLKGMKDFSIQITTKGKLGIFYPETANYEVVLEKLKPFLIRADGSQAKIISVIDETTPNSKSITEKGKFGFWEWLKWKKERDRLEEARMFEEDALPMLEHLAQDYGLNFLKPYIEHDKEINKKLNETRKERKLEI
jgi:hypothetical protein